MEHSADAFRFLVKSSPQDSRLQVLSRVIEQSPVSIVITDVQGNIEYVNHKFCALTGYSLSEVRGCNPRVLKSGETGAKTYRELWTTLLAGGEWRGEFHNKKKDGQLYWEYASICPLKNGAGEITHFLAMKEDITTRKQAEADNARLVMALEQALAEVKTLRGLIPICAGCKKIRVGASAWEQIETYISKRSAAKFTHSICPDCMATLYPGLVLEPYESEPDGIVGKRDEL